MNSSPVTTAVASQGAGGILLLHNHILLVQVNYGPAKGHWILPGGFVEPNEHPHAAAEREFVEETGVKVKAQSLVAIRYRNEKTSDLAYPNAYWAFQMVMAEDLGDNKFPKIQHQPEELLDVRFWQVDEALQSSEVRPMTQIFVRMGLKPSNFNKIDLPKNHRMDDTLWGNSI